MSQINRFYYALAFFPKLKSFRVIKIAYKAATSREQLMKEHHAGLEHVDEQMTVIFFSFYFIISIFGI